MRALFAILIMPLLFSAPVQFAEAVQAKAVRSILPSSLSSAELERISSDILERALFSARTTNAEYLQTVSDVLDRYLAGDLDLATARLELKQKLAAIGYVPDAVDEGGLKDLSSDERINLVIKTNAQMARGYGAWMQGQGPGALEFFPAQELYRAFNRKTHRQWSGEDTHDIITGEPIEGRWVAAGGQLFDGRMIALKNDPIWTAINRFGNPYPPFDFNSGMWTKNVTRKEAVAFGLLESDTQIAPETRDFNQDLKFTPAIRNAALRQALTDAGYNFIGDILSL